MRQVQDFKILLSNFIISPWGVFLRECIIILVSASVIGIIFMLGKFPDNKSFENR